MRTNQKHGRLKKRKPIRITGVQTSTNHHRVALRRRVATAGLLVVYMRMHSKYFSKAYVYSNTSVHTAVLKITYIFEY